MPSRLDKSQLERTQGHVWGDGIRDDAVYFDGHSLAVDLVGRDATAGLVVRGLSVPANVPTVVFQVNKNGAVSLTTLTITGTLTVGTVASAVTPKVTISNAKTSTVGIADGMLNVIDTTAFAAGVGGAIVFEGKYNTAGTLGVFGQIAGVKANATDGNYAGDLVFYARVDGGSMTEGMRMSSAGVVTIVAGVIAAGVAVGPSVSGFATFNIPHGVAPSAPVNGDIWTTTAGLFVRVNGATVGPLS